MLHFYQIGVTTGLGSQLTAFGKKKKKKFISGKRIISREPIFWFLGLPLAEKSWHAVLHE